MKKGRWFLLAVLIVALPFNASHADMDDGLVAFYPFNGNANDESGNGNHGILIGPALTGDRFGNPDSAYAFDGTDDYIDIGNQVKPPFPISISFWVKLNELGSQLIFRNDRMKATSGQPDSYYHGVSVFCESASGHLSAYSGSGYAAPSSRYSKITDDPVFTVGNWHHIVVIWRAYNDVTLYADNQERSGTYEGNGSGMTYSNDSGGIGSAWPTSGSWLYPVNGVIDDIRVYNRSLNGEEVGHLFIDSGASPGGDDGSGSEPIELDISGQWSVTEVADETDCGEGINTKNYSATVVQNGDQLTYQTPYGALSGRLNGHEATWSGQGSEDGGTLTTNGDVTFSADGTTFEGNENWSWSDGSFQCSGTSQISGSRSASSTDTSNSGGGGGGGCFISQATDSVL